MCVRSEVVDEFLDCIASKRTLKSLSVNLPVITAQSVLLFCDVMSQSTQLTTLHIENSKRALISYSYQIVRETLFFFSFL